MQSRLLSYDFSWLNRSYSIRCTIETKCVYQCAYDQSGLGPDWSGNCKYLLSIQISSLALKKILNTDRRRLKLDMPVNETDQLCKRIGVSRRVKLLWQQRIKYLKCWVGCNYNVIHPIKILWHIYAWAWYIIVCNSVILSSRHDKIARKSIFHSSYKTHTPHQ